MKTVSIITINYNSCRETEEFLDCIKYYLKQQNYVYEVIVVDNASKSDDANCLERKYPWVKVVRSKRNLGFSGGNNLGVKYSKGDYCLFINNDVVFTNDFIEPLLERLESDERIGAVCPSIYDYSTKELVFSGVRPLGKFMIRIHFERRRSDDSREIALAVGTAVMAKQEVCEVTGGWPELFFLYEEELDWSLSIRKSGFSIWYEKKAFVYHKGSMSTGKDSPLQSYYLTRNRLLLYKRNLKGIYKIISILNYLFISLPQNYWGLLYSHRQHLIKFSLLGVYDFFRGAYGMSDRVFK